VATHQLAHQAGDRTHRLVFEHNPLTDRASLLVDGEVVPTKLVRKPFGSVFRYRFSLGGEALEVRVAPSSLVDYDVAVSRADEPLAKPKIGLLAIASACGLLGAIGSLGLYLEVRAPLAPSVIIGTGAAAATTALLWLVYGRAR